MDKITNIEQLFIRACKVLDSDKRIRSVYRRFYCLDGNPEPHIILILADICDKYIPMKISEVIDALNPSQSWNHQNSKYVCNDVCLSALISRIRLSNIDSFPGISTPAKFRDAA